MRKRLNVLFMMTISATTAMAQDFAQGPRRNLIEIRTSELPQGSVRIGGGERILPPGGRSPWHTSGPKLVYVIEGTLTVEGLGGQIILNCGPAPKLCWNAGKSIWFNRNAEQAPVKFLIVGIDSVGYPTIHEEVGQVTAISSERVTLAVGDHRTSDLAKPRREVTITVSKLGPLAVGDDVVTVRHNEKDHKAESLLKLSRRWQ